MMRLFLMECGKTARGILYWLFVLVLFFAGVRPLDETVESELRQKDDPSSVFYTAADGVYAGDSGGLTDREIQENMMTGAAARLLDNYRKNVYEYYPFGYVKTKTLSEEGQEVILSYLEELTGMGQEAIDGTAEASRDSGEEVINEAVEERGEEEFRISGGGAYILEPGQGSMAENGQYVIEPGDWKYTENSADITGAGNAESSSDITVATESEESSPDITGETESAESSPDITGTDEKAESSVDITGASESAINGFEIKVPFDRFQEIMGEVDAMIGRGSYFSREMLELYYCGNDMEGCPMTERQHREFYEGDHVTGAFARYYCDSISLVVLGLPALVMIELMMKDKNGRMQALVYSRAVTGARLVCTRFAAAVCMVMLLVLILPARSLMTLIHFCRETGVQSDAFAFVKYVLLWILPTVMLVMAMGLFLTILTGNYFGILFTGLLWLAGRPSIGKIAGGNYDLFDLIIRHNTLKGYGRMMEKLPMLVLNRGVISGLALLFVALAVIAYETRRKGADFFENRKLFNGFKVKYAHKL